MFADATPPAAPNPTPAGALLAPPLIDPPRDPRAYVSTQQRDKSLRAISLTGGHRNDVTQLLPLIDGVGPVRGKVGRPRQRAERVIADRGYDHDMHRRELRTRGVTPVTARRGRKHGSGMGRERWVVERMRRLRTRYERHAELHLAFMLLGCAVVCQRRLSAS